MARKNRRNDDVPPLDLAAAPPAPLRISTRVETEAERDARIRAELGRKRERNNRRQDARVLDAIADWDLCCIPGCGENLRPHGWKEAYGRRPDPEPWRKLPLCKRHETIIAYQAEGIIKDPAYLDVRKSLARQRIETQNRKAAQLECALESDGAEQGQIYFLRLNDMVKVGWSSKLRSRFKQYGASAEILCHYPASRADETLLHRQLKPYRAKGREWYEDCKLIADVVAGIIDHHGAPTVFPIWTEPKQVVAGKRHSA